MEKVETKNKYKDENIQTNNNNINEESKLLKKTISQNGENYFNEMCAKLLNLSDGLSTFSNLAITYYFKDNLKLSPSQSALIQSILSFPNILKPLFGFMSDIYPFFGYKRKSYIVINSILIFISWLILSFFNPSVELTILILLIKAISKTFLNACSSAVLVEISKKRAENSKKLENFNSAIIYINIGTIISSTTRGIALEIFSTKTMFLISGILSFLNIISGILYQEIRIKNENNKENNYNKKNHFKQFYDLIKQKQIFLLLVYMLIMTVTPSYYESSFYFLTDVKGFTKIDFGNLTIILMVIFFINSIINKRFLNLFKPQKVIIYTTIIAFLFSSVYNIWIFFNLKSKLIIFAAISLYIGFKALSVKPIFNLGFLVCPKGYEGSVMGLFYSIRDLGDTLASLFGSALAYLLDIQGKNYLTFNKMIYIINFISLLPIIFINIINDKSIVSIQENKD